MFRISRRLDYGLQLMIALAQEPADRAQATATLSEKLPLWALARESTPASAGGDETLFGFSRLIR